MIRRLRPLCLFVILLSLAGCQPGGGEPESVEAPPTIAGLFSSPVASRPSDRADATPIAAATAAPR